MCMFTKNMPNQFSFKIDGASNFRETKNKNKKIDPGNTWAELKLFDMYLASYT